MSKAAQRKRWLITDKGDQDCRILADGHYSRQSPGDPQFTRNGQNLVFVTADLRAVWVTFRPTPGKATRMDGLDAWECSLFRNTWHVLSSDLIREAVLLTSALWGHQPTDGFITSVDPEKTRAKPNPGYCFLKAGWEPFGLDAAGRPRFKAPRVEMVDWRLWKWKAERGGKLRRQLEQLQLVQI